MKQGTLDIDFLTSLEELELFRPEWEALFEESDASPYLCFEWMIKALRHFPPSGGFYIGIARDEKALKAIIPFEIAHDKIGLVPQVVLRFALHGWPLRHGALLSPDAKGEELTFITKAGSALLQKGVIWDYCHLLLMEATSLFLSSGVEQIPIQNKIKTIECIKTGSSIVIELPDSWEKYLKILNRNSRENIKRKAKLLEQKGRVRIERLGPNASYDAGLLDCLIQDALTVSSRSWQGKATVGHAISDDDVREFFRDVSSALAAKGMLDLSVLYLDNCPISFIWGPARWPTTSINKLGFDQKFAPYSPGNVHLAKLIEDSISRGYREIDFGHEFPEYKKLWGKRLDDLYHVFIYTKGMFPFTIRALRFLKRKCQNQGPMQSLLLKKGGLSFIRAPQRGSD